MPGQWLNTPKGFDEMGVQPGSFVRLCRNWRSVGHSRHSGMSAAGSSNQSLGIARTASADVEVAGTVLVSFLVEKVMVFVFCSFTMPRL